MDPSKYGVQSAWGMFRARGELTSKFAQGDKRFMFYTEGQSQYLDVIDDQSQGYFPVKWTNLNDEGVAASKTADGGVDTDYPMFRLADVYLMYGDTSGDIKVNELTLDFILDERARELYTESVRRTDLIRYNEFTTSKYLWQWKGGTKDGMAVDSKYNIYPIPNNELTANPNLHNDNY